MTEPTITFKHTNTDVDYTLQQLFSKKFAGLQKYFKAKEVLCEVEFRKEAPHKNGDVHVVEVNLTHDGTLYRAEAIRSSFEQSIDQVGNELDTEIRRSRNKRSNLFIKGARRAKEMMQFGR